MRDSPWSTLQPSPASTGQRPPVNNPVNPFTRFGRQDVSIWESEKEFLQVRLRNLSMELTVHVNHPDHAF